MSKGQWLAALGLIAAMAMPSVVQAQPRPYIGFVYPAGGQQGATFRIRLGGQGMNDIDQVLVSGKGVRAKLVD